MRFGLSTGLAVAVSVLALSACVQAEVLEASGDSVTYIKDPFIQSTESECAQDNQAQCDLQITDLAIRSSTRGVESIIITTEIADTPASRARGLMFRQSLPEFAGMLFVFSGDHQNGFWMKDTSIPLDIAYLAGDGTVLEIVQGEPYSLEILRPSQPYRYALELNGGWFECYGFGPGDQVDIPGGLTAQP